MQICYTWECGGNLSGFIVLMTHFGSSFVILHLTEFPWNILSVNPRIRWSLPFVHFNIQPYQFLTRSVHFFYPFKSRQSCDMTTMPTLFGQDWTGVNFIVSIFYLQWCLALVEQLTRIMTIRYPSLWNLLYGSPHSVALTLTWYTRLSSVAF